MRRRCMLRSDRKSTRLNSSHTVIYTLSLHDALPISPDTAALKKMPATWVALDGPWLTLQMRDEEALHASLRSEEHTSELQSHRDLHSFPTRRSSDLPRYSRIEKNARDVGCAGWPVADFANAG